RWPAPQRRAPQEGAARAARSVATPMARNSNPAASVDPSDRANQPLMTIPTPARASAAPASTQDAIERLGAPARTAMAGARRGTSAVSAGIVAAVVCGRAAAASFTSCERNSSGIRFSEDGGATSVEDGFFLRCRGAFARSVRFLAFFGAPSGRGITDAVASSDMGTPLLLVVMPGHDACVRTRRRAALLESNPFRFERFVN